MRIYYTGVIGYTVLMLRGLRIKDITCISNVQRINKHKPYIEVHNWIIRLDTSSIRFIGGVECSGSGGGGSGSGGGGRLFRKRFWAIPFIYLYIIKYDFFLYINNKIINNLRCRPPPSNRLPNITNKVEDEVGGIMF